jgi:hypothetical protein
MTEIRVGIFAVPMLAPPTFSSSHEFLGRARRRWRPRRRWMLIGCRRDVDRRVFTCGLTRSTGDLFASGGLISADGGMAGISSD